MFQVKKYAGGGGVSFEGIKVIGKPCIAVEDKVLKARHYIFVGSGGAVLFCLFFSIQWVVGFCGNVYFMYAGGGFSQKCSSLGILCSNGIFWNEKKFLFLEADSPEKNELWHNVSAIVVGLTGKLTL